MTSVREFLIICGGCDYSSRADYNDMLSYNTVSSVWKRYQPPVQLDVSNHPKICSFDNKMAAIKIDSLVSLDVTNSKWDILFFRTEEDNVPPPILLRIIFCYNESLYVFGNRLDDNQSDEDTSDDEEYLHDSRKVTYKFCLQTSTWSLVQQIGGIPNFYDEIHVKVFNNQLYIFDPYSVETNKFTQVTIFDLSNNKWTTRATNSKNIQFPSLRGNEAYAFSSDCAYMSGGRTLDRTAHFSDIWRMDFESLEWIKLDYECVTIDCQLSMIATYIELEGGLETGLFSIEWNVSLLEFHYSIVYPSNLYADHRV
ncbi:hypothetical protein RF11_14253 [Thelohanellus kitauei]|uniref:Uncharacterized protein n=1 Tax=Thelohanellus kitauei TaxID=669202 RepID=A0A0C2MMR3_THEKT|nr:hypothetical protein RF11_14253 [Thelohanellus kitauei]